MRPNFNVCMCEVGDVESILKGMYVVCNFLFVDLVSKVKGGKRELE